MNKRISLDNIQGKLSRSEMKKIMGGTTPGTCTWHGGGSAICNISKETAQGYVADAGGNWCCDNCPKDIICND